MQSISGKRIETLGKKIVLTVILLLHGNKILVEQHQLLKKSIPKKKKNFYFSNARILLAFLYSLFLGVGKGSNN